jgi:hypothetical protein
MTTPEEERRWAHFNRPLWESLSLADGDPYGGLFGSDDDNRRGLRVCKNCGAKVSDRGLHYRFHVQIAQLFALLKIQSEREILSTITENDDPGMIEIRDFDGNLIVSLPQRDPDE